jgi:hypothetical protein
MGFLSPNGERKPQTHTGKDRQRPFLGAWCRSPRSDHRTSASIKTVAAWRAIPWQSSADFDSTIRRFESSRCSHAFSFSENILSLVRKARQMRAFLIAKSRQRPTIELFGMRIPESLRQNPRKLPFSGDSLWRPKNKSTACQGWQLHSGNMLVRFRTATASTGTADSGSCWQLLK